LKVMGRSRVRTVNVRADGTGLSSRTGTALLPLVAGQLGLTGGLSDALAGTRERRSGHDPGLPCGYRRSMPMAKSGTGRGSPS
jgi:hypothetical protein